MRMAKIKICALTLFLLAGCAAPMTKGGFQVRQLQYGMTADCKFLGIVETEGELFYSSMPEAKRDMLNKIRNETARLGGNAFAITTVEVERGFSLPFAPADAYLCTKYGS